MRRDSSKAVATDSEGHELRINDNVKEVDGAVGGVYLLSSTKLKARVSVRVEKDVYCIRTNRSSRSFIIERLQRMVVFS
jgi:hypothetical protein